MSRGQPRSGMGKEKPIEVDVHPPSGQRLRHTNQLKYVLSTIMRVLVSHDEAWPFLELLTPQKICMPNYYEVVKRPMSFRVIKKRLKNKYYWSSKDAIKDIRLVFKNAYKVSAPHRPMHRMAKHLKSLLRALLRSMPRPEIETDAEGKPVQVVGRQIPDADEERNSVFDEPMNDHDNGDRLQARKACAASNSHDETVALQEVQDAREIELEINEGHSSDAVKNTWMKLEDLETAFAAYSKYTEGMVDPLRMALCGDIDRPMLDTEKVLVEEVHEVRKIEREMKEDFLPNSLDHIWMELGTLEAKFAAYSNHVEEMIDGLRKILGAEHSLG